MKLESYVAGRWVAGTGEGRPFIDPTTGAELGRVDATGLDGKAALAFARDTGGPALAALSFAERGALLKAVADVLTANREAYGEIARKNSGNTVRDAAVDIDGGIGTTFVFAIQLLRGRTKGLAKHNEIYWFYVILLVSTALLTLYLVELTGELPDHNSIRAAAFQAVSIMTTTGYSTMDYDTWLPAAKMLLLILM